MMKRSDLINMDIKAIREVRVNVDSHGSLNDCVRLVVRSNRRRSSLINLLREDETIQARVGGQAPKEVVERAYRDSMSEEVEELSKYSLFGKYTPDALDQVQELGSDGADKEIKSRAPNLYELLHGLCRASAATSEGHNATRVMSILSVICFTKHQRKCNFLPGLMSLLFQSAVKRHLYYITRAFGFTESHDSAGLIAKAKDFIKNRIRLDGSFAFVYDNCDLSIGVSEQGKKSELISIASALIVPVVEPPLGGLKQAHFDVAVGIDLSDSSSG